MNRVEAHHRQAFRVPREGRALDIFAKGPLEEFGSYAVYFDFIVKTLGVAGEKGSIRRDRKTVSCRSVSLDVFPARKVEYREIVRAFGVVDRIALIVEEVTRGGDPVVVEHGVHRLGVEPFDDDRCGVGTGHRFLRGVRHVWRFDFRLRRCLRRCYGFLVCPRCRRGWNQGGAEPDEVARAARRA